MKLLLMHLIAKHEARLLCADRIHKVRTGTLYLQRKKQIGKRGCYIWQNICRVSDHYATKGKGKIRHINEHCKIKHIIVHSVFNIEKLGGR